MTQGAISPRPQPHRLRRIVLVFAAAALPLAGVTIFILLARTGEHSVDIARDFGQLAAAGAAGSSCGWAASRASGRMRVAWALIAGAATAAFAGEIVELGYVIGPHFDAPSPSASDIGILASFPLAAAGLLALPSVHQYAFRLRAVLDFVMVACSLVFVSAAFAPAFTAVNGQALTGTRVVGLAYASADILLLTAIFVTLRRSVPVQRARIVFLLVGLAVIAISDSLSAILSATGGIESVKELVAAGSMYGFALVALSPLIPEDVHAMQESETPLWQSLIPYIGVAAVVFTAIWIWAGHGRLDSWAVLPGSALGLVLVAGQLLNSAEMRAQLRRTREAEAKVHEREAMLNDIIENAPQGVATFTGDRRILNANPRLASMLSAPLHTLIGSRLDGYLTSEYVVQIFDHFDSKSGGGEETYASDSRARRADGSEFWLHWSVTPIRDADGEIEYFMAMFDDITARREAEETAVANLAQLEQLNRMKSEFVSVVSHEFRTGLVGIQGFSELIRDQEMDMTEIHVLADEINTDAQRLNRMISDMLDFDRFEAGKIRLNLRHLDLNELAGSAVERAQASTKEHLIDVRLESDLPEVLGDEDRLTQVLTNLLSNAIKYSPGGGEILVSTRTAGPTVEIAVKDHGRGIPPEFLSRLFGRYERYEDKNGGKIVGTGLGLAIAKQIVELHGGKISVDSEVGEGSEFRVCIPAAARRPTERLAQRKQN